MNTINNNSNGYNSYIQNNAQVTKQSTKIAVSQNSQARQLQDTVQFSKESLEALSKSNIDVSRKVAVNPLADLVSNGKITQDEANSIQSTFEPIRQANQGNKQSPYSTNTTSGSLIDSRV